MEQKPQQPIDDAARRDRDFYRMTEREDAELDAEVRMAGTGPCFADDGEYLYPPTKWQSDAAAVAIDELHRQQYRPVETTTLSDEVAVLTQRVDLLSTQVHGLQAQMNRLLNPETTSIVAFLTSPEVMRYIAANPPFGDDGK